MPFTDPNRSFSAAVRHLFRHIDDVAALRRNRIARSLFDLGDASAPASRQTAYQAAMTSRILDAGRDLYTEDLAAGPVGKAHRFFAILSACCAGRPVNALADELGISLPQAYRDRRAACERVIRALLTRPTSSGTTLAFDPLRLALWRVDALCEQGFGARAVAECERIIAEAASPSSKALAMLTLADAALKVGDTSVAAESLRSGSEIANGGGASIDPEADILAKLVHYRLAMHVGRHAEAFAIVGELAEGAANDLTGSARDDLRIEILLEQSRCAAYAGDAAAASEAVSTAARIARRNPAVAFGRRVEIAVLSATFGRGGILEPAMRVHRLREALALAFSAGSTMGVLFSSVALAHECAASGEDAESRTYADQALRVARAIEGRQGLLFSVASLAPAMIKAGRVAALDPDVFDVEPLMVPMTDIWMNVKLAQGALLGRTGRSDQALAPLTSAVAGARSLRRPRTQVLALREFALCAHDAGRSSDARDGIHAALTLAEGNGDVRELRATYRAASTILGDARFARLGAQSGA
jgi:hypothetical protein